MGIILFFVALITVPFLSIVGLIYSIIKLILKGLSAVYKYIDNIAKLCALVLDQFGNVVCADLLNDTLYKKNTNYYPHGNRKETASSVLGKNKIKKDSEFSKLGDFIANKFLEYLDENHVEESIDHNV
jgi:uncharacterized membrane protein YjgN (DUF898 family)